MNDETSIYEADMALGNFFEISITHLLNKQKIDLIASHGQTISHEDGCSTRQIGDLSALHETYSVPMVFDFRQGDINEGGNGAPLMPFLDWILFKEKKNDVITLNLGGIANISYTVIINWIVNVSHAVIIDSIES